MPATLRIATWNVWWRFGDWERRRELIAAELRRVDADVVCLQEVHAAVGDRPNPPPGDVTIDVDADPERDQAAWLAAACGHRWSATAWRWAHEGVAFGNAVLSRTPPVEVAAMPLPGGHGQWEEHRTALAVILPGREGFPVVVVTTHLNFMWDQSQARQAQVAGILEWLPVIRPEGASVVLTGDLNAEPHATEIATLTGAREVPRPGLVFKDAWDARGEHAGHTWSHVNELTSGQDGGDRRIDYVLLSFAGDHAGGRVVDVERIGTVPTDGMHPSDHFGVVATIEPARPAP